MKQEELNYIKESFSQIIDDIAGNPEWYEASRAIASELGFLERELEKKVVELPSGLDESGTPGKDFIPVAWVDALEQYGKWKIVPVEKEIEMAEQGQSKEGIVCDNNEFIKFPDGSYIDLRPDLNKMAFDVKDGEKVIVQIRKIRYGRKSRH